MGLINITVTDIETTGLEQEKGDRIIEIACLLYGYDTDTGNIKGLGKYVQRIYPDRAIGAKAQAIHGISIDDLVGMPLWEDVAPQVANILDRTDLLVGHNIEGFDGPFIANELVRVGLYVPNVELFCTMDNGRFATYDGSVPSLRALAKCFGMDYDQKQAHGAEYDTALTAKCFFMGLRQGYYQLPSQLLEKAA